MPSSFASGYSVIVNSNQSIVPEKPYDPALTYNRIVEQRDNDPQSSIYSIDPSKILKMLSDDALSDLYLTTLGGKLVRDGVAIWDTLFNNNSQSITACILTATDQFKDIPKSRIVHSTPFLSFGMSVSRVYLNQMQKGDVVGIAINDAMSGTVYVLLYVVDGTCSVVSKETDGDGRANLIPAMNIRMQHAMRIDNQFDTEADPNQRVITVVNMEDDVSYDQELAQHFVNRLIDNTYAIRNAYPWKRHFMPFVPKKYQRDNVEKNLDDALAKAQIISYDEFEDKCTVVYNDARQRWRGTRDRKSNKPQAKNMSVNLPLLEVITIRDDYYICLGEEIFKIDRETIGDSLFIEDHFTNKDLDNRLVNEASEVLVLNPQKFGDKAYFRLFTISF